MTNPTHPPSSYFDLLDACAQPGCPVCRLEANVIDHYLTGILYENVNDHGVRAALSQSRGYCHEHAWLLTKVNSGVALGIALLYRQVAREIAGELEKARYASPKSFFLRPAQDTLNGDKPAAATEAIVRRLQPQAQCPACVLRDRMIDFALRAMLDALAKGDERLETALRDSAGLCLPHLVRAFELSQDEAAFDAVRLLAQEKLDGLLHELDEFIRKNDYRFLAEGFGEEGTSWRRVVAWTVGEKKSK